jgi:hypothetical protein
VKFYLESLKRINFPASSISAGGPMLYATFVHKKGDQIMNERARKSNHIHRNNDKELVECCCAHVKQAT